MALRQQPAFQNAMLKAHAKGSMTGNRPNTKGLQTRLHAQDLGRKRAFKGLSQQRQRSDLAHAGRTSQLKLDRKALKDRKKALPWQIGIGAGTALLSGLEGQRRAGIMREAEANRENRFQQTRRDARGRDAFWQEVMVNRGQQGIYE